MRIDQILGSGKPAISFEFFPPKTDAGFAQLYQTVGELHAVKQSSGSVMYGAGASKLVRPVGGAERLENALSNPSREPGALLVHTGEEIGGILDNLWDAGIRN